MDISRTMITRRLEAVLNGLQDEFRSLYTREDFEWAVGELARSEGRSDHSSKKKKLFRMFDCCGISYEKYRDLDYYKDLVRSIDVPSADDIEDRLLYALYSVYEKYPAPDEYMERLVNRLCSPEDGWEASSLWLPGISSRIAAGGSSCGTKTGSRI